MSFSVSDELRSEQIQITLFRVTRYRERWSFMWSRSAHSRLSSLIRFARARQFGAMAGMLGARDGARRASPYPPYDYGGPESPPRHLLASSLLSWYAMVCRRQTGRGAHPTLYVCCPPLCPLTHTRPHTVVPKVAHCWLTACACRQRTAACRWPPRSRPSSSAACAASCRSRPSSSCSTTR